MLPLDVRARTALKLGMEAGQACLDLTEQADPDFG